MKLQIDVALEYNFPATSDVLLQLEAADIPEQAIENAHIDISPTEHFARVAGQDCIGERIWLRVQDKLTVNYTARVAINRLVGDLMALPAVPTHMLPGETVQYMLPSRYCPSDRLQNFVESRFAGTEGGARAEAIRDWIASQFTYRPGTSTATTGALETLVSREGVCRDFAHVMIALLRASAIPARFVSVYAPGVQPQDFHAVAEIFLDGTWYLADATGMARPEAMAKIGVGRDAADVPFLTAYGNAEMQLQQIEVTELDG
ncbi:MAG: transglutaminase family protein [Novosphingobium sp.]